MTDVKGGQAPTKGSNLDNTQDVNPDIDECAHVRRTTGC